MNSTKEKIINTAYDIFLKKGYTNTTITEISTDAGIAYGTVYFYFQKGKAEVLNNILSCVMEEFYELLNRKFPVEMTGNNRRIMYKQMIRSFEIVDNNRRIMQVFWEAQGKSALIYEKIMRLKEKFIYKILEIIQSNSEGITSTVNKSLAARALMHMIWGFIWEYAYSDTYAKTELADTITILYERGVYS